MRDDTLVLRSQRRASHGATVLLLTSQTSLVTTKWLESAMCPHLDLGTGLVGFKLVKSYEGAEIALKISEFIGTQVFKKAYSDGHTSLRDAVKIVGVKRIHTHECSAPGAPASNPIIERENYLAHDCIRAALVIAGMPLCFWSFAGPCCAFNRNCEFRGEKLPPYVTVHGEMRFAR